ncbi:hypothetical protein [Eubacterium oxidoreducens]|uniref:Lipoprotein n=1 Tax=Eubacterium oxidoreducens TaxID=1732 RepID=A0A1G6A441_EUBOX|nr:hypothetical protein [Eubacterium oxidoreducens]SDB03231.1 hypothetical protein SAMN02910417_00243 [Eubacterium oxidoreducens]
MKNHYLSRFIVFTISAAFVFGLTACGNATDSRNSDSSTEASFTAISSENSAGLSSDDSLTAPSDTDTDTSSDVSENTTADINNALSGILAAINSQVQPETAGSTINAQACAQELMDWGYETGSDSAEIENTIVTFMSTLSADDANNFKERLELVDQQYQSMIKDSDSIEAVETVMEQAGLR